jgi:conjugative transfer pilus assembly protein TraH
MSLAEWGGVDDWVNEALFGTTSPSGTTSYTDSSLIGAFVNKRGVDVNGSNLSTKAKALLQIAPVPVIPLLLETQKTPGAAQMIGLILAQHMPRYFEYVLGVEIINIASNTFANQTEVSMPDDFRQRLESMNTSLALMRPSANSVHQMLEGTMSVIKHSQTLVTSPVRAGGAQR